ncbi:MAG: hypothetical protein RR475_02955 [Clostridia bacterium]
MSKYKGGDKQIAKITLAAAIIALITQLASLLEKLVEWLSRQ